MQSLGFGIDVPELAGKDIVRSISIVSQLRFAAPLISRTHTIAGSGRS